ncbi:hypothetical protein ACVWZ6_008857 [Bradyrhizobium sp. GM6.1]
MLIAIPMTTGIRMDTITPTHMSTVRPLRIRAQAAHWSILRMTMAARLAAALAVCAVLWGVVFLAMR